MVCLLLCVSKWTASLFREQPSTCRFYVTCFSSSTVGSVLYRKLQGYLMTEEQLQEHGYPRPNPEVAGRAVIHNLPPKKANTDGEPSTFLCSMTTTMLFASRRSNRLLSLCSAEQGVLPMWSRVQDQRQRQLHPEGGMQLSLGPSEKTQRFHCYCWSPFQTWAPLGELATCFFFFVF